MLNSIFDIIDKADADGYGTITVSRPYYRTLPSNTQDALRKLIHIALLHYPVLTLKLEQVKKWVKDLGATGQVDAEGNWTIKLNIARLMYLPCEKPEAELAELRTLFETMKGFFENNAHRNADVQVCNNRDHHKRVYGTISCRFEAKAAMERDEEFTQKLRDQVEAGPTLQFFLKNVALSLQKLGPWSWALITEDQLYGRNQGPSSKAFFETLRTDSEVVQVHSDSDGHRPKKAKHRVPARVAKRQAH